MTRSLYLTIPSFRHLYCEKFNRMPFVPSQTHARKHESHNETNKNCFSWYTNDQFSFSVRLKRLKWISQKRNSSVIRSECYRYVQLLLCINMIWNSVFHIGSSWFSAWMCERNSSKKKFKPKWMMKWRKRRRRKRRRKKSESTCGTI